MDLSLAASIPRALVFYGVLLFVVFPVMHLIDRLLSPKRSGAKKA